MTKKNEKAFYSYKNNFSYELHFASLIAPNASIDSNVFAVDNSALLPRKVHLKKSYLALSWFNYLTTLPPLNKTRSETSDEGAQVSEKVTRNPTLRFNILPSKRSLYTLQKAPMAHKTNSKEQFMFKFYFFKLKISTSVDPKIVPRSVNASLLAFYLMRNTFPVFETNLLFLKYYQIRSMYADSIFFDFNSFVLAQKHQRVLK